MRGNTVVVLAVLIAMCSGLCWLPLSIEPSLDLPSWIPLLSVALCTGIAILLNNERWLLFLFTSGIGALGGLCLGYAIWWPRDPIAGPLVPYSIAVNTIIALIVSLMAGFVARKISISTYTNRTASWIALVGVVAFGPVLLLLTPPLVARRMTRDDRLATERFESLKSAVERTVTEGGDQKRICDGSALRQHYAGPPFSHDDWRRITSNYVKQDGYVFMIYCREKNGYTIAVRPDRDRGDGTRQLCTDESRRLGCPVEWDRSRYACLPCIK